MTTEKEYHEREIARRLRAVVKCPSEKIRDLLVAGGFDPRTDLRYRNLSGMSFVSEDLRGFDFTGTDISNCDFTDALITGAHFDQAILGYAPAYINRDRNEAWSQNFATDLFKAKDYNAYKDRWINDHRARDGDMPVWALFRDSPFTPQMTVYPSPSGGKLAVSRQVLLALEGWDPRLSFVNYLGVTYFDEALGRCKEYSDATGRQYRLPTRSEMHLAMSFGVLPEYVAKQPDYTKDPPPYEWCREDSDGSKGMIDPAATLDDPTERSKLMAELPRLCFRVVRSLAP